MKVHVYLQECICKYVYIHTCIFIYVYISIYIYLKEERGLCVGIQTEHKNKGPLWFRDVASATDAARSCDDITIGYTKAIIFVGYLSVLYRTSKSWFWKSMVVL